ERDLRLERERPGAVLVRTRGLGDEGLDGVDRDAGGHFPGGVPAHAVGDDVKAEIGAATVTVFVAASTETGVRADGPGELHVNAKCRMLNAKNDKCQMLNDWHSTFRLWH